MAILTSADLLTSKRFDYIIVGGGTAGCVIANRLSGYLPDSQILMIEAGPSDIGDSRALILRNREQMEGTVLERRYTTVEQPMGNSKVIHSRAIILGGCSSHNDMVSLQTPELDARKWEELGCDGWSFDMFQRLQTRLLLQTHASAHPRDQNQLSKDWILTASRCLGLPLVEDFNKLISSAGGLRQGAGWTPLSYDTKTGWRESASVAYIHPLVSGDVPRTNLTILTNTSVSRVNTTGDTAVSVDIGTRDGSTRTIHASREIILCAGAIDTPRLMLLSGIGPRQHLESVGIPVTKDIPGVGENLQDHPATSVVYELHDKAPNETATFSDMLAFIRHQPDNFAGDDAVIPDLLLHTWGLQFNDHTSPLGYDVPAHPFSFLPVVLRPRAKGRLYLQSSNPSVYPALDFKYFEDPDGYDASILVAGIKAARRIAESEPLRRWIKREIAPGPAITSDEDLSSYARSVAHTMFHPACTAKMGNLEQDPLAVLDSRLRVRGLRNLRVADASVFPVMVTVNIMLTVLTVGERAAELIAEDAGWQRPATLACSI